MKTLDEVIKAMNICLQDDINRPCDNCPYPDSPMCINELFVDALSYLKEYKELSKMWNDRLDKENSNPALTWEQLKQMEGKPVWVDAKSLSVGTCPYWKDWYIIKSFSDDEFMYCNDGFEWAKKTQGRLWQAYRKERK